MSEFTSSYIDPAAQSLEGKEVISTEETANKLYSFNKLLKENKVETYRGLVVGSLVASALYPSLDHKESARIVRKTFEESDLQVDNVDYKSASMYLALNVPRPELEAEG